MPQEIFIAHAGADSPKAAIVAGHLKEAGIAVRLDRVEVSLGDSFLGFMENALTDSDYCLLLWSQKASETPWVTMEWEAALYRSVQEKRSFLVTARLENLPVPALLGPRLMVDLFPDWQPGIGKLVETWQADRAAEQETQRPVANGKIARAEQAGETATVYVTSDSFGITVPLSVDMEAPAGIYLDRLILSFDLPRVLDYKGRSGVRYEYRLMLGARGLDRGASLVSQGVRDKTVLSLETTMTPYSQVEPVSGALGSAVFRGAESTETVLQLAQKELLAAIVRNGLGP